MWSRSFKVSGRLAHKLTLLVLLVALSIGGIAIQHPNAAIIGTSRINVETGGVSAVRMQRDDIRASGKSIRFYPFPPPGSDTPVPKVAYAAGHDGFGLIISTSDYIDDIEDAFRPRARFFGGVMLATVLLLGGLAWLIARGISRPLGKLRACLTAIAAGDLTVDAGVSTGGEVGEMARAIDICKQGLRETERLRSEAESATARAARA